jgi:hypothetical protein
MVAQERGFSEQFIRIAERGFTVESKKRCCQLGQMR